MSTEQAEVTRNGDLRAEDDGFQRVLTSSERRGLKKKQADLKRVTLADCNALENSILSRLKKRGLDLAHDPDHSTLETSTVETEELAALVAELDEAAQGLMLDAQKPDQNLSVADLDGRIRVARTNLAQMRSRKKGTFSAEELETAAKETDVYIAYLQQQMALTREYQKLRNAQSSLLRLKAALKECMALRARPRSAARPERAATPSSEPRVLGTTKRSLDYVCEFIREMKERQGLPFDASDLTSQDFRLADGTRFLPPYTFLQKLKQKFHVFIDKSGAKPMLLSVYGCSADVRSCLEYLGALDLGAAPRLAMSFSRFRPLLELEAKYNVLLNYNSGSLDVLGSSADVKAFLEHVDSARESTRKEGPEGADAAKGTDVTDVSSDKDRLFDYYVLRALSGKFRPNVRELEAEFGVGIKFDLTPRNGLARVSFVPLLDNPIDKCVQRFASYVDEYGHRELGRLTPEELAFLTDNDVLKKRYRSQHTTLVKAADKVFVVGLKKHLNFGFARAQLLLESRLIPPHRFRLSGAQYQLLLPHLLELQDQKGVYLTTTPLPSRDPSHRDAAAREPAPRDQAYKDLNHKDGDHKEANHKESNYKEANYKESSLPEREASQDSADSQGPDKPDRQLVLYVYGNAAQQKESVSALNDMLSSFTSRELALSGVEYSLLAEDRSLLAGLEARFKVKSTLTKTHLALSGPKSQTEPFAEELAALFARVVYLSLDDQAAANSVKNEGTVYAALLVPQRSLGKIIGRGGSTLKQIMLQSSLHSLVITKSYTSCFAKADDSSAQTNASPLASPSAGGAPARERRRGKEVDVLLLVGTGLGVFFTIGLVKQVVDSDDEAGLPKADVRSVYDEYTSKHSILRRTTSGHSSSASTKFKSEEKLDINDLHNFPSL